ncbi:sodium:proton antiporter [Sulfitobacter sp. SK011]|uniref:cation:proton antiporter n=1 Tax=Sulfitobacter sp. SK011 TaxID=1389004 RepID=UPI000E0A6C00|nr:sodium:proton antiporter [Sulfitobacter sp. SK011]AXI41073.1 sodium:proton exchanger [Sulfitobacter sp. SK011]
MTTPSLLLLTILAAFGLYALLSKAIDRSILTLPLIFTLVGLALSEPVTRHGNPEVLSEGKRLLAEITLILILFSDASHVRFSQLRKNWVLPARMLVVGMPLTVGLGTVIVFWLNPASGFAMALLTAAVLTPTDAALGQAVLKSPDVPEKLSETINVESGLNDGLALPFVLLGALLVSAEIGQAETGSLAISSVLQIIVGPLAGIAIGWAMARLTDAAQDRDLMGEAAGGIVFLSTAFGAYLMSEQIGGNGFISAFVAGMVFGNSYRHDIHFITEFMEDVGQLLTMAAFLVFGAILLTDGLLHMTPKVFVLAILFLTVVRMAPIFLSLAGTGLTVRDKLFLGWFGPRGLASILFTLIIVDEFDLPGEAELLACVSMTVAMSVLLHGLSATPFAKMMRARV